MAFKIKEKKLDSWEHFKEIANNIKLEWIFRGQANSMWPLATSIERSGIIENNPENEERLLFEFKKASKFYFNNNSPSKLIDWLAMLQHYGVPTRLLDFTKSPYVAAFFALEEERDCEYASVFIANKISFYNNSLNLLIDNGIEPLKTKHYNFRNSALKKIYKNCHYDDFESKCIIPIESHFMNERYLVQQGVFLSPVNPYYKFEEQLDFLESVPAYSLIKMLLPRTERKKALRDLEKMNVTHASLFPGIEGFSKSLTKRFTTLKNIIDMAGELSYLRKQGLIH